MNAHRNLPHELRHMIEAELDPNESPIWAGQPIPRRMALKALPAFLFAIPFTAFAIFWICGASGFKVPDFSEGGFSLFPLFGIPFLLVGLGMLSSPLWKMRSAKRTVYILTEKRAVIFSGGWKTDIRSFSPDQLQDITRKQHADGSGDVVFKREISNFNHQNNMPVKEIGFLAIEQVKKVEDMIRAMAKNN